MLIDSGPKISQNHLVEYMKNEVLASNNKLTIDYLLLTHPDGDHSGAMCAMFGQFDVIRFFRPNIACESENINNFAMQSKLDEYNEVVKSASNEKGLQVDMINQNYEIFEGGVYIQIFAPLKEYSTTNEMSPVVKVSYLRKSFLFVGDLQIKGEADMIEKYGNVLDADVLKVGHHGSGNSTSLDFVEVVSPDYAVICVGSNTYGHPNFEVVERLQESGSTIYTTEESSVRFVCSEDMFGVLNLNIIHSYEFVEWWIIALIVEIGLVALGVKIVIKIIKNNKSKQIK
jgi:beta-lactamase superfamily II metal-dependent hydrolase